MITFQGDEATKGQRTRKKRRRVGDLVSSRGTREGGNDLQKFLGPICRKV
jgi:hypothetical protein